MQKGILTSFHLKLIAIVAMTIDHFSNIIGQTGLLTMFPDATLQATFQIVILMNQVGRIAFPLFAFMIAEGTMKTRSMPRYIGRLALFALISEPVYFYAFYPGTPSLASFWKNLLNLQFTNIFVTLTLAVIAIYIYQLLERKNSKKLLLCFIPILLLIMFIGGYIDCDYGAQGIILIVALYFAKTKLFKMLVIFAWAVGVYGIWISSIPHAVFAAMAGVLVLLYNGKRGLPIKWSFYLYYPAHLLLLLLWYAAL